jgi:DNA-directed RNA polymerase subunit RPC12/RpoP
MAEIPGAPDDDLVIIARFSSLPEAEGARSALESAGIEAFLADENTVGVNWLYSNALGGMRLYVNGENAADASRILGLESDSTEDAPSTEETAPLDEETEPEALGCGECGSTNVTAIPRGAIALIVAVIATGVTVVSGLVAIPLLFAVIVVAILLFGPTHRCRDCGTTFVDRRRSRTRETEAGPSEEIEPPDVKCPRCGSLETETLRRRRIKGATLAMSALGIFLWLPFLVVWMFLPKHHCIACGNEF